MIQATREQAAWLVLASFILALGAVVAVALWAVWVVGVLW